MEKFEVKIIDHRRAKNVSIYIQKTGKKLSGRSMHVPETGVKARRIIQIVEQKTGSRIR
ncbi:MAG: hypothetical protein [Bacteriophage sp.]|nr:MAG: hypothetical protein [Bacteriophage sp.]